MSAFDEARSEAPARGARVAKASRSTAPLEVASGGAGGYQASDYTAICSALERDLHSLAGILGQMQRAVNSGAAPAGLEALLRNAHSLQKSSGTRFDALAAQWGRPGTPAPQRAQLDKYRADIAALRDGLKAAASSDVIRLAAAASSTSAASSSAGAGKPSKAGKRAEEEAQMMAQMTAVDLTEALIEEREAGIDAIARDVQEVHGAMADLAVLVNDQGDMLTKVETNVGAAANSTEKGVGELEQAAKYQSKYRRCIILLVCILLLIGAGLTAYFLITNKNK